MRNHAFGKLEELTGKHANVHKIFMKSTLVDMLTRLKKKTALVLGAAMLVATLGGTGTAAAEPVQFGGIPFGSSGDSSVPNPLTEISSLDLKGYQGLWYQLARVPQPFDLQCASDSTATYTLLSPQLVGVQNRCRTWWGTISGVDGKARVTNMKTNASLRVAFDNIPFQNINGSTNYRVTWMSPSQDIVIVGGPNRRNGFLLSRTKDLSPAQWTEVKNIVAERGWDACRFVTSPVTGGVQGMVPLCAK